MADDSETSIKIYLREIMQTPLLTAQQESELAARVKKGDQKARAWMKSQLEWAHQSFDGRMDYSIVATSTVQDLLGRPALTLREWAPRHREALLAAASK